MHTPLYIIFDIVTSFAMLLIFFRFMLQFAEVSSRNPIVKPAYRMTKVVDVFGRIFPTLAKGRISTSAIVLLFLLRLIDIWGKSILQNHGIEPIQLFFSGSMSMVLDFLSMCRYIIMASILASWIVLFTNSMNPVIDIIMQLSEPILAPFRRIIPNLGMIDLSPILAFFSIFLVEKILFGIDLYIKGML